MKFSAKTLCISGTAAFLTSGTAFAQEACKTYVVQRGDTLSEIARTAYGDDDLYPVIYSANRQTVGPLADLIETGIELDIPCTPDEAEVAAAAQRLHRRQRA